jgi:hypothetical protein
VVLTPLQAQTDRTGSIASYGDDGRVRPMLIKARGTCLDYEQYWFRDQGRHAWLGRKRWDSMTLVIGEGMYKAFCSKSS